VRTLAHLREAALAVALVLAAAGCVESSTAIPSAGTTPAAPEAPATPATGAASTATSAAASTAAPAALAESEVPRAAIAVETRIRALRSLASRTRDTESITASSVAVLRSVDALKEWMRSRDPRQQTLRSLRSLAQEWRLNQDHLVSWMEATGSRLDALTVARSQVQGDEKIWSATETALAAGAAPPALVEHTHDVVTSLREVDVQLGAQIDSVLLLQSRISSASLDAEEALDSIAAALRKEQEALFTIESPPIWKAFGAGSGEPPLGGQLAAALHESARALRQYAERAGQNLQLQLGFFVVLAVLFFRLRRRSRAWPRDDKGIVACARLVERPILGALLVALLCGIWLHPRAPLAFYELSSVLLVLPVVALMGGIVSPRVRGALYLLAAIFVVERVWESTPAATGLERAMLLGLAILSAAVLAWTIRPPAVLAEVFATGWWRAVTLAGRAALVALGVALLANVAGNVTLARMLTATVVRAAYWGVVLYAADLLLRGTATLLVRSAATRVVRTIDQNADLILRRAYRAIDASAVVSFLLMTLNATGQWSLVWRSVGDLLTAQWGIGSLRFSFASALVFVITLYVSIVVARLLSAVLEGDVYPRVTLPRGVPGTFTMLVRYGAITLGFLLAAAIAGIPLDRLAFVLGAFSVGIGFGLQTVVNNFVSGLILMFERPIQIGDTVDVGGLVGRVRHIGVRASRLETSDGAEVIVPNGALVSDKLINWTLTSRNRRIEIQVSVARGTDAERALAVLREAVSGTPDVLADPAPTSLLRAFGASTLDLSLFFWTAGFDQWLRVRSDVTIRVSQALRDAGIELADRPAVS